MCTLIENTIQTIINGHCFKNFDMIVSLDDLKTRDSESRTSPIQTSICHDASCLTFKTQVFKLKTIKSTLIYQKEKRKKNLGLVGKEIMKFGQWVWII